MTHEEYQQSIDDNLLRITQNQLELDRRLDSFIATSAQAGIEMAAAQMALSAAVTSFVSAADARLKQIEANQDSVEQTSKRLTDALEALIRAITAERGNGAKKR